MKLATPETLKEALTAAQNKTTTLYQHIVSPYKDFVERTHISPQPVGDNQIPAFYRAGGLSLIANMLKVLQFPYIVKNGAFYLEHAVHAEILRKIWEEIPNLLDTSFLYGAVQLFIECLEKTDFNEPFEYQIPAGRQSKDTAQQLQNIITLLGWHDIKAKAINRNSSILIYRK